MPTLGPAVRMDSLAGIGRQQNLVRTIAEAIVAAAAGRSLRVAVGWSNPDEVGFADQLTQALLARGLPCRCLSRKASRTAAAPGAGGPSVGPPGTGPMVAVITSGTTGPDETDLCRIDIQLHTPTGSPAPHCPAPGEGHDARRRHDGQRQYAAVDEHQPDIVVDYLAPDGPIIRHIAPALTPPAHRP